MGKKLINSQLCNFQTYLMIRDKMIGIAQNVLKKKNLPLYIDSDYVNFVLLTEGSICFFIDEEIGLLALPYTSMAGLDVYGRPRRVQCHGRNGYKSRILTQNEFVIMYDNTIRRPLYPWIVQYAERYSSALRTQDVNIAQQKSNRIWKTSKEQEKSVKDMLTNIEENVENIVTYNGLDIAGTESILSVAPYVADKIDEYKANLWNEFLGAVGVSNITLNKKERLIRDEVQSQLGGTIAMRGLRYDAQKKAVDEINLKFRYCLEKPIELEFYDGVPSTNYQELEIVDNLENENEVDPESEVAENV